MEVVTWYDPLAAAARGRDLSGVDYLRAMWTGELPDPPDRQGVQDEDARSGQ
jgi:hypothetical protein